MALIAATDGNKMLALTQAKILPQIVYEYEQ